MAEDLALRDAEPGDVERVFEWLNDPVTRAMSLSTKPVAWTEHSAWFCAALSNGDRHLFIAELDGTPFALLRLDRNPDPERSPARPSCTISINVAPSHRGGGLGIACLRAMTDAAKQLGFAHVDAQIRSDNSASRAAFTRAGYRELAGGDQDQVLRYRLELDDADQTG